MEIIRNRIKEILKDKVINKDLLTVEEKEDLIQKLSVYHEELYFQNEELKSINYKLEIQKAAYESLFMDAPICYLILDEEQKIIKYNSLFNKIFGVCTMESKNITQFIHPDSQDTFLILIRNLLNGKDSISARIDFLCNFKKIPYKLNGTKIPNTSQIRISLIDISEEILLKEKSEFLSFHDQLTNLYNRRFLEEEYKRLDTPRNYPLGIIMADLNGLKLVNDAFGHNKGDQLLIQTAKMFKLHCRQDDIIARIGGDEFMILLPNTDEQTLKTFLQRIKNYTDNILIEDLTLSVSYGYSIKEDFSLSINEHIKKAEDRMYSNKLLVQTSQKRKIIEGIISSLHEKHPREEKHSERVSFYAKELGKALNLDENIITNLQSAGLLHDIGKIAIDYSILDKSTSLTLDEIAEIRKHPEIGYRILQTSGSFSEISDSVLSHHERLDGKGYPRGLSKESISLEAKILAICDAYDAMISDRPYRKGMNKTDAIKELLNSSNTQFDLTIVNTFINEVLSKH